MKSRLVLSLGAAILLVVLSVSTVLAGEITGNGRYKGTNGRSACSFSGQQDLQWFLDDGQQTRKLVPTKGDPSHSQSWGQSKADWAFLISLNLHPGQACNPNRATGEG
jgi:hypothetical protein